MYKVKTLSLIEYIKYRFNRHGIGLLAPTDSGYPKFLSLGTCYHSTKEIVVCEVGNWKLRLLHEQGHEQGLKHTMKVGYVMHPWGLLRGDKYL